MRTADVIIVGGGIVGLATAYQLSQSHPRISVIVIEKENRLAAHQTGRNSGVLHSGIYYSPGSLKAKNCRVGKIAMEQFCQQHEIEFQTCGKVIVATSESELPMLDTILKRGQSNGVRCRIVNRQQLAELEPHVRGERAIHVLDTGIVDYTQAAMQMAKITRNQGGSICTETTALKIRHGGNESVIQTNQGDFSARLIVNCGGLQSDRITILGGHRPTARIVPFRGEYYRLKPEKTQLCRNLIYPVPDPKFPFLGVHFTRRIDGRVECGPNAVLAFAREGYSFTEVNLRDLFGSLTYPGFVRLALRHCGMGMSELWRSLSKRAFVRSLQRLVPEIQPEDLETAPAGVRAQAVLPNGKLVDDFLIVESSHMINVVNAPSPAATAALNIGQLIVDRILPRIQ